MEENVWEGKLWGKLNNKKFKSGAARLVLIVLEWRSFDPKTLDNDDVITDKDHTQKRTMF